MYAMIALDQEDMMQINPTPCSVEDSSSPATG